MANSIYCARGSRSQIQQAGIERVAMAAIQATAENPAASNADAEIPAMAAIPTCDAAFLTAIYSPRTDGPTISVVIAWRGAWRAAAAILKAANPRIKPRPSVNR